jgi:hypothetical protein
MQSAKKTTLIKDSLRAKAGTVVESQTQVSVDQRAVDEGRKPLTPRRKDAEAIRTRARQLYGVPATGLAAIPSIESLAKFSSLESDEEFLYLHVEALLDQAASLLERCRAERSERDALQIEKWKLQIELDQASRLDQLHQRQRQAGLDTLPYERAVFEAAAERSLEVSHRNVEAQLKGLMDDLLASGFNRQMAARELSAWLSAYPLKDTELRGDDAVYSFDGARKSKPEHLFDAARVEADEAAWERVYSLMAQRFTASAASEAGRLRKESLDRQAQWSLADIGFRGERVQVADDSLLEKVYQAQSPKAVLNYAERIAPLERRFAIDFRDALARLMAARRGLEQLYGYASPFPEEGTPGYFDEVVNWVRRAANRIEQFTRLDQTYVLALSVKDLTKTQWEAGRSASEWTFEVPPDMFQGQAHVRLRGLGVAVVGPKQDAQELAGQRAAQKAGRQQPEPPSKPEGFWTARVSAPPAGKVRHMGGAEHDLDQKAAPTCHLGRVADRDSYPEPDIVASNVLHNASPIGKQWKLTLSSKSTDGTPTDKLSDVQLYLRLAVRSLKAGS